MKFKPGQTLTAKSICNSECIYSATVIKRTAKTVTILMEGEKKRCKIYSIDDSERIYPLGRYSMAPSFRAP